jgi:hypothetical protein
MAWRLIPHMQISSNNRSVVVAATTPQILLHPSDCTRYGVSIISERGLQVPSLDEFGDHLSGGNLIWGPSDVAHGPSFGKLTLCMASRRRSKTRQRADSLNLVGKLSFAGVT